MAATEQMFAEHVMTFTGPILFQLWVAYAPCGSQHKDAVQITLEQIDLIKRFIEQYSANLQFVTSSSSNPALIHYPEYIWQTFLDLRSGGGSQGWQDRQRDHGGEWTQHRDQSGGAQDVLQVRIITVIIPIIITIIITVIINIIAGSVPGLWRWLTTVTIPGPTPASWTRRGATPCTTASPPSERWARWEEKLKCVAARLTKWNWIYPASGPRMQMSKKVKCCCTFIFHKL